MAKILEVFFVNNQKSANRPPMIRVLVVTAMMSAVATVLMFLEFPVPLVPSFIKMDLSELPALLTAFLFGPLPGVAVCLVKNLINLLTTYSGGVGELANFLLGVCFVLPAGWVYRVRQSRGGALLGALAGAAAMALISVPINYFVVYPAYTLIMPMEAILGMYQAINPHADTLLKCLVMFNMPFTLVKALISVAVTFLIYKPLSPILKGKRV